MSKTHLPDKIGFSSPEAAKFPSLILIASASPCNLGCPGCPSEVFREIRKTKGLNDNWELYLRPEYYKKIADECSAYTTQTFTPRIRISGYGEPMLHKQLTDLIVYSCKLGVKTSLITNGTLLTPDKAERMLKAGLESIEFSVDAHNAELYDKVRPPINKKTPSDNFRKVLENIRSFIRLRNNLQSHLPPKEKTFIITSIVKGPLNYKYIDEIKRFWIKEGVDHISVRKFLTWGIPELEKMQEEMNEQPYLNEDSPCPYPFERCMVDPGGFIRLCPYDDQRKIPEFGHIAKDSIAEVWQGNRWQKIRSCHKTKFDKKSARKNAPLCAGCLDRKNRSWTFNYISIAKTMTQKAD